MQEHVQTLIDVVQAMAHAGRLRILGLLAEQRRTSTELSSLLSMKDVELARHLAKLREVDLIETSVDGTRTTYGLNPKALQSINKIASAARSTAPAEDGLAGDDGEKKVLRTFLRGDELIAIPENRRQRLVVLAWLARCFEDDVRYSEAEVNRIIRRHHADCATLRRNLVDEGFMQRDHGVYWRLKTAEPSA
ncbi:MAG TPA: DUF2087 domain-containing protein [Herpetosiphonaceae bacterium]